jgi:hypothetical protein
VKDAKQAYRDSIPVKYRPYLHQIESKPTNLRKMVERAKISNEDFAKLEQAEQSVSFLSYDLDFVFDRERQEHEAAKRIQKVWRKIGRLKPWHNIIKHMLAARTIQRIAKGWITRKWLARWFKVRDGTVVAVQASLRRMFSNNKVKPVLAKEQVAVVELQRICRGKFGRLKAHRVKYFIACVHIQAAWRGAVARARADKLWLNRVVVPIQTLVRRFLARIGTGNDKAELDRCALLIQKKFRSFVAVRKAIKMLNIRENEYRMDNIAQLTAEEEHVQERIEKMIRRLLRKDFQGEASGKLKRMLDSMQSIYELENDVIEMNRQREILSPRAIVQGYYQELSSNVIELRDRCTKNKMTCLFQHTPAVRILFYFLPPFLVSDGLFGLCLSLSIYCCLVAFSDTAWHESNHLLLPLNTILITMQVREIDVIVDSTMSEIERTASHRGALALCRELEYADRRERTYQKEMLERSRKQRMAIAEERRKWKVCVFCSMLFLLPFFVCMVAIDLLPACLPACLHSQTPYDASLTTHLPTSLPPSINHKSTQCNSHTSYLTGTRVSNASCRRHLPLWAPHRCGQVPGMPRLQSKLHRLLQRLWWRQQHQHRVPLTRTIRQHQQPEPRWKIMTCWRHR